MSAGVSIWWATPTDPARHFADEELTESDRYHSRVRRAGVIGAVAKVLLLLAAMFLVGASANNRGAANAWADEVGWFTSITSTRVLFGSALTVAALRLPAVLVDGWFEYRFRQGRDEYTPVPLQRFVVTTTGLTLAGFTALAIVAGPIYWMVATTDRWPFVLCAAVVIGVVGFAVGERWLRRLSNHDEQPIENVDLSDRLRQLATPFGLRDIHFATATATSEHGGELAVPNAYSVGLGANRRVVLTEALLEQPHDIADFVVAHELTHVARRHVLIQTAVAIGVAVIMILGLAALGRSAVPWRWWGVDAGDPLALPIVALCVLGITGALGPLTSWLSRAQERMADSGAIASVGVPDRAHARRLYLATISDLRPPWWARLYAPHPTPAERLEFLARQRS